MKKKQPSNLEMQVLAILWKNGPQAARRVAELLPDGKTRAYTTVLSTLQAMERKNLVSHTKKGVTNIYGASVTKAQVLGPFLRSLVTNVFGGSTSTAVQHLLDENEVGDEEMSQIRDLLDRYDDDQEKPQS